MEVWRDTLCHRFDKFTLQGQYSICSHPTFSRHMDNQVVTAMAYQDSHFQNLPIGITSLSLGRASVHCMEGKIQAAAAAGFRGIEIFFEDIEVLACELGSDENRVANLQSAAHLVRRLCDQVSIDVINLQPFRDYEGLVSKESHEEKISELKNWLVLCKILRTTMIVIASSFPTHPPIATGDEDSIINDLREAADLGARQNPPIRFAYEAISWGAYINTWQHAWKIIQKADRPNLGLCLDTFHILAKFYGSPESSSGRMSTAVESLRRDLQELARTVRPERLFSVQLADAAKLNPPLSPQHPWYDSSQSPLMTWSRQARLFPLEEEMGAYLPVLDVLRTCVVGIGYRGWISFEVFNVSLFHHDRRVPSLHAQRGMRAWNKCREALNHKVAKWDFETPDMRSWVDSGQHTPNHSEAKQPAKNLATRTPTITTCRF